MNWTKALAIIALAMTLTGCINDYLSGKPNASEVAKKIIAQSIAKYDGNCPCPYNVNAAGNSCGQTSAYSKAGGASPICYESQVTPAMIAGFTG